MIPQLEKYTSTSEDARDIVFIAQMPHVRSGVQLEYSPWFQYMIGFLEVEVAYHSELTVGRSSTLSSSNLFRH